MTHPISLAARPHPHQVLCGCEDVQTAERAAKVRSEVRHVTSEQMCCTHRECRRQDRAVLDGQLNGIRQRDVACFRHYSERGQQSIESIALRGVGEW